MGLVFTPGMTVRVRGERFTVVNVDGMPAREAVPVVRLILRALEGELRGEEIPILYPVEQVIPDELPGLSLDRPGRLARFRLLHDAFRLRLALPEDALVGRGRSRLDFQPYQFLPTLKALQLPRPRLLIADDVGLGKTVEAGIVLCELNARRRANRVLIVCPAGIMHQWQKELRRKFGFSFRIFDRDGVHEAKQKLEAGSNPWAVEPRVIASMDFIKRREGAFRELSAAKWDVIIVDEAHHVSSSRSEEDVTDRTRLGRSLSEATDALLLLTATPHDGYDESLASLLSLLEPNLVPAEGPFRYQQYGRHLVRRLKRHIKDQDGSPMFILRPPPEPVPVELTSAERELNAAVLSQASDLEALAKQAGRASDAEAIRFVATVLRKRAASSRCALATTVDHRKQNLEEAIQEIEIQREHLRALRRGEALPDETLTRLERDAHRNYLSVIRRLGKKIRTREDERSTLDQLEKLLRQCESEADTKMVCLLKYLREIHRAAPDDKIIVFSEYSDTIHAIAAVLDQTQEYGGKYCIITGDDPPLSSARDNASVPASREQIVEDFWTAGKLILLATDAAGEGLNLHAHCHRILHFELPWNPNRLEQRNGRVDRYGQKEVPLIAFLYARDTYEGEVLTRLVDKIERQIQKLGSVGDVLGRIQAARIEEIIGKAPADARAAIEEAERQMDEEIERTESPLSGVLGEGVDDQHELRKTREAVATGTRIDVDLGNFVSRAVVAAGGRVRGQESVSVDTPISWLLGNIEPHYEDLVLPGSPDVADEDDSTTLLNEHHPLVQAAERWVRTSRFARYDDHRLAYACTSDIAEPEILATFIVRLRDGEGREVERLEVVKVSRDERVSQDRESDLAMLDSQSSGNVPVELLVTLFDSWWKGACEAAKTEAQRRAERWLRGIRLERRRVTNKWLREFESWDQATKAAILGTHVRAYRQLTLFDQARVPPAVLRRLRQHEERARERRTFMERWVDFEEPDTEPLGVLLRVPLSALQEQSAPGVKDGR